MYLLMYVTLLVLIHFSVNPYSYPCCMWLSFSICTVTNYHFREIQTDFTMLLSSKVLFLMKSVIISYTLYANISQSFKCLILNMNNLEFSLLRMLVLCIYIYIVKLYFHYIHCCNISLTNCECLSSKHGISKNSLRVRLQV